MLEKYQEPEDLLSDESFLSWYFKTEPNKEGQWESWIAAHPEKKELVRQAVEILSATRITEAEITSMQRQRAENALMQKIARLPQHQEDSPVSGTPLHARTNGYRHTVASRTGYRQHYKWIAAASVAGLIAVGIFIDKAFFSPKPELTTQYGQISQQALPDGTQVILNANSRLTYSPGWKEGGDRNVWVNGEAFFHVVKTPSKSRFIVHTDHFDIIVTGTQFNVVNRHHSDNVILREGSVIIHSQDGHELHMVPGDFVEFDHAMLVKRAVKSDSALAWKEHKLIFDKTPLRDVIDIIRDHYGVPVRLASDTLADKTISGILPNNNLEVLLEALAATADFEVTREHDSVIIRGSKAH